MKKEFLTSGQLMEAVRKLDYKGQYKVCEAFFNMMMEEGFITAYRLLPLLLQMICPKSLTSLLPMEFHWKRPNLETIL